MNNPSYLFAWSPDNWPWKSIKDDIKELREKRFFSMNWSCGVRRNINPGDRIFLVKLGRPQPRGIVASGYALSGVFRGPHRDGDASKSSNYVEISFDVILDPQVEAKQIIPLEFLKRDKRFSTQHWSIQGSGVEIKAEVAEELESLWLSRFVARSMETEKYQIEAGVEHVEGAIFHVLSKRFERDVNARRKCIERFGASCAACGINFSEKYGEELGRGFIHVHHVVPLHTRKGEYKVNPEADLVPVCPNCHAMIHRKDPPLSIEALRKVLRKQD